MIYQAQYWKLKSDGKTVSFRNDKEHFIDEIIFEESSTKRALDFVTYYADQTINSKIDVIAQLASIEEFYVYQAISDGKKEKDLIYFAQERIVGEWNIVNL